MAEGPGSAGASGGGKARHLVLQWPVLSLVDLEVLESLRVVCVFGAGGNEAMAVTDGDEVYAVGSNASGCLGVGDTRGSLQARRVESLCSRGTVYRTYEMVT